MSDCQQCGQDLPAGYLCDECDSIEKWRSHCRQGNPITQYHTDQNCRMLQSDPIPVTGNRDLEPCSVCATDKDLEPEKQDWSYQKALSDTDARPFED